MPSKDALNQVLPIERHRALAVATPASVTGTEVALLRVHKAFGEKRVLDGIDLIVEPNEFVALVGRSGCGKSTLLRLVAGLDQPTCGSLRIDGEPLFGINPQARVMFQDARLLPWLRVGENVALARQADSGWTVAEALQHVQLADREQDWPAILSGGQRQRVALARALIARPRLLLLDEPLGSLDALTRIEMQSLIHDLWQERACTAMLVTHDIEEAVLLADRVLLLEAGQISLEFTVDLPRPRVRTTEVFQQLVRRVLDRVLQHPE